MESSVTEESGVARPMQSVRLGELDALRGLAALGVLAFHYTTFYQGQYGHAQPLPFGFSAGNYGVQLFFTISGFVIFMTLERTRTTMDFVVSRFSRLFPAYWAAIATTAAVVYTIGMPSQRLSLHELLLNPTMVQQLLGGEHLDGSYWTLQIELFFYAQMLFWFAIGQLHRIRWIIAGWLLLAAGYGMSEHAHAHFSYTLREVLIVRDIAFFSLGILFYRMHRAGPNRIDVGLALACLGAIWFQGPPAMLPVALVCCAVFALFLAGGLRWLAHGPFLWLGGISYSLYLLHQAIGFALIHRLEAAGVAPMAAVALALAAVLLLASALNRLVERPAMRAIRDAWRTRTGHARPATGHA